MAKDDFSDLDEVKVSPPLGGKTGNYNMNPGGNNVIAVGADDDKSGTNANPLEVKAEEVKAEVKVNPLEEEQAETNDESENTSEIQINADHATSEKVKTESQEDTFTGLTPIEQSRLNKKLYEERERVRQAKALADQNAELLRQALEVIKQGQVATVAKVEPTLSDKSPIFDNLYIEKFMKDNPTGFTKEGWDVSTFHQLEVNRWDRQQETKANQEVKAKEDQLKAQKELEVKLVSQEMEFKKDHPDFDQVAVSPLCLRFKQNTTALWAIATQNICNPAELGYWLSQSESAVNELAVMTPDQIKTKIGSYAEKIRSSKKPSQIVHSTEKAKPIKTKVHNAPVSSGASNDTRDYTPDNLHEHPDFAFLDIKPKAYVRK